MKLTAVIALGSVLVLAAFVYVLNRPQLTTIDAAIPQYFPADGFSHEVFEQSYCRPMLTTPVMLITNRGTSPVTQLKS